MKYYILLFQLFIAISTFAQCPQPGMKVQSKDCIDPKALAINQVDCRQLKMQWAGSSEQQYFVTAIADSTLHLNASKATCDDKGVCTASVDVKPRQTLQWAVQAVCNIRGTTVYSSPVTGPVAQIPACTNETPVNAKATLLQVYPNPSDGRLNVVYKGNINSQVQIFIYDATGKQVYNIKATEVSKNILHQQLNLQQLPAGVYSLEILTGQEKIITRFIIAR